MLRAVLVVAALVSSVQAGCIALDGAQITAGDLAKASAEFARLDPALVFSFAPVLGSQRTIPAAELGRWAADHGLGKVILPSACFERASHELAPDEVLRALNAAFETGPYGLHMDDLHIDVVEVSRCRLPAGRLEFSLTGASPPPIDHPETPVLWRGRLVASDGRLYPVWARVRVLASVVVVRAATDLRPRKILSREDLEQAKIFSSPLRFQRAETVAAYEGFVTYISVPRGTTLQPGLVHRPFDVERGSLVEVQVVNGGAKLALAAHAETAGNTGDVITLTNPIGAARFRASVTGPARAEILLSPERLETASIARETRPGNRVSDRNF